MTKTDKKEVVSVYSRFLNSCYKDLDGNLTLRYLSKRFFQWDDGVYSEIDPEEVKLKFTKWVSNNYRKVKNTKHQAEEALHHVRVATFTEGNKENFLNRYFSKVTNSKLISFQNGIVSVDDLLKKSPKNIKVIPHTPDFFNLAKIPFPYLPDASCENWLSIVEKVVPYAEDRKLLRQWFGYHLIPTLAYSKMMFFEGSGANGKSVILLVLRLMLGEDNVSSLPLSAFDYDKPFRLAATEGKLANICEEMGATGPRLEETVKQFVNGGAFTVEKKFKDPFTLYPTAKLTFATNEMPSFADRSNGFWRRMLYIKFFITITIAEQRQEFLERDFWHQSGELSGVLNWALAGAKDILEENGFAYSDRKSQEIQSLFTDADLLRPWVTDNFVEGFLDEYVSINEIFDKLKDSVTLSHLPRVSHRELLKEIKAQFPNSEKSKNARHLGHGRRGRVICGIKWRPDTNDTGLE